ncbi:hypothetical protein [Niabella hirudinis]|uniref:hypothetical protein n=1 Tax=Niabella hirudinis TaxID=1285929 RepID=UPI003EBE0505
MKTADIKKRFDYALIIRADFLSIKELDLIKSVADQMISFHFDGMHRYPKIFRRIAHFDRFFVFDPEDAQKYAYNNVRFMPNCYFDYPESGGKGICPTPGYQLYYLGSFEALRTKEILRLQQYLAKMGFNHKIDLVFDQANRRHITPELEAAVTCLTETISFEAHQQRIERTNILLDFALDQHTGLSYRIFESIKYEKKLITTNVHVVNYDFYTPENIFILNDNYSELYDFIETPYTALPSQIKKKYSFTSWIKNIFNDPPLEDINLIAPKKVSDKTIRVPAAKF